MSAVSQKAVIFDMGGVILRTEDTSSRIKLATKYGISHDDLVKKVFTDDLAQRATLGDITEEHYWQEIGKKMGISADEMESFQRDFWAGDRVDQELVDFIKNINSSVKKGLLSNAWSGARSAVRKNYRFLDIFDVSVFSAEVGLAKPDPAFYLWILDQLQVVPQKAIFVDDFIENIEAADALGLATVHFKDTSQTITKVNQWLQK